MPLVLHLMPLAEWQRLGPDDAVTNPSLATEGFIHCTDGADVLLQVANAFYTSVPGEFVVLDIDVSLLTNPCVWEEPAHIAQKGEGVGEAFAPSFPHVYGPIDRCAVVGVRAVHRDTSGAFTSYA
jgi:uncharacterized protein (DUF952 family)